MSAAKKYVNLWAKTDKHGNPFLSGKDKATGNRYFVFSDKEDPSKKRLTLAKPEEELVTIGDLSKRTSTYGDFLSTGDYIVSGNKFYKEEDPYLTNKAGEYVIGQDGEKIDAPQYQLSFPSE